MTLSEKDALFLQSHGIEKEEIEKQIACLSGELPVPAVLRAAKLDDGIFYYNDKEIDEFVGIWNAYLNRAKRDISHFIPASGQSNRFLRDLKKFLYSDSNLPRTTFLSTCVVLPSLAN